MNNSDKLEDCKKVIRSILIPYQKGCLLSEFNSCYRELIGRSLPINEFGFRGDIEFLYSMPDVVKITQTRLGDYHLEAIADEKSKHIQNMVAKQKPAKSKASSRSSKALRSYPSRMVEPRRFGSVSRQIRPPVIKFQPKEEPKLPPKLVSNEPKKLNKLISIEEPNLPPKPSAKDEVIALVQYFDNEIALKDLLCAYQRMYQKNLSLSKYGFSSLEECIEDISELVIKHKNNCTFVVYQLESSDTNENYNVQDTSKLSSDRKNQVDCSVKKSLEMPSTSEYSNNQNNDKSDIPDSLRKKLKMVAEKFTQGIWSYEFPSYYEKATGVELDLYSLGYRCLSDLIDDVPDIFTRETVASSKNDYIIYSVNESRRLSIVNGTSFMYQLIVNLRRILQAYPEGIQIENFLHIYSINFRDTLHIKDFGFDNVETFLLSIKNQVPLRIDSSKGAKIIKYMPQHNDNSSYTETPLKEAIPFDAANPEFKFKTQTLRTDFDYSKDYFSVYTSAVASPGHLYIQLEGKETTDALGKLANNIEDFYNKIESELYTLKSTHIKVGASCVAKWPTDQHWYRAEIISVLNTETVMVLYVDYGTRDTIPNNLLRYIKKEFIDLPAQAVKCRLAFLKPAKNAKKWDFQSKDFILKMCEDVPLMAKIEKFGDFEADGIYSIVLCDTNGESDIYINDVLCDEGFADYTIDSSETINPAIPVEYHHNLSPLQAIQALYYLQAFVTVAPSFSENENYINLLKQVTMCCSNTDHRMQNVDMPHRKICGPPGFNTVQPSMHACPNLDLLPYACHIPSLTPEANPDIKYKHNTSNFPVHVTSPSATASTHIETSTAPKEVTTSPDEFVDAESELFVDDDDDEIFQQFCHKISSSKIQHVKRVMLGDGYKIHVIVIESKPYASSGDISHIIWNNKETDYLFRRLQLTDVDIQAFEFCEDGNEDLFQQLEKFEVKGIEKKLDCAKTSILLHPLKLVIKILNHFGHPSVSLRTKLTEEIANFNPNDPDWTNFSSPEPLDPEDEANASGVTDDDKIEKLCLFDLLAMKESITWRKKKLMIGLGTNTKCDEIDKLEQLNQKVLQRIQEIKEICSVFS